MNRNKYTYIILIVFIPIILIMNILTHFSKQDINNIVDHYNFFMLLNSSVDEETSITNPFVDDDFISLNTKMLDAGIILFDEEDNFCYDSYINIAHATSSISLTSKEVAAFLDKSLKNIYYLNYLNIIPDNYLESTEDIENLKILFDTLIDVLSLEIILDDSIFEFNLFIRLNIFNSIEDENNVENEVDSNIFDELPINNLYLRLKTSIEEKYGANEIIRTSLVLNETNEDLSQGFIEYAEPILNYDKDINVFLAQNLLFVIQDLEQKMNSDLLIHNNFIKYTPNS